MTHLVKYGVFLLLLFCLLSFTVERKPSIYPYKNPKLPVEQRLADLIGRMTLKEKILQLDMFSGKNEYGFKGHEATEYSEEITARIIGNTGIGSIHDLYPINVDIANKIQKYAMEKTRLGIPVLFIEEGLHGYSGKGSTSFPIPIELSSAWDTSLVRQVGHVIATETRAHGVEMILGPVLCLPNDPRWGRVEETYGEDPYLDALNGVAMIKGLQGKRLSNNDAVIAEPKHFAVHGIPEAGSNTAPVNIGEREARSRYLYVFEKAIKEGGAMGIMAAYSEIDGVPCVDNKWLLTDVLRKEWGFKGFVLSDLGAIKMSLQNHAVAVDASDALSQTFNAGLNMQFYDFGHDDFVKAVTTAVNNKTLSLTQLNKTVADILRVKFLLGMFDHPYTNPALISEVFHTEANQDLSLKAAREGICLLKNDESVLPITNAKSIAVIGPLAESTYLGGYSNDEDKAISILDGLKQRAGNNIHVNYEPGYQLDGKQTDLQNKAVDLVKKSDVAVVVLGEETNIVGEGKDRAELDLSEQQMNLIKAIQATGKPVVAVLSNGRPITINWVAKNIPSVLETWFGGEKSGLAVADVLLGNVNPSGKLPITFPRSVGQIPFYYDHKPTSYHKYVDEQNTPLFAFGHGLSYTTFDYSNLHISPAVVPVNGTAEVSVKVKNSGKVEGTEVVQLYLRDEVASVTTPILALKGFQRINLKPGESGIVKFKIGPEHLSLWNRQMKRVVEPGMFKIMVGSASDDIRLTDSLKVVSKL
ncbi:beta-glucosidase [Mucilaginibacter frigoritolerans]|uniref:Beta-glucosidase n=1 Tax=Mucilaginibacter frigoritolerans TaxID=652788 RepID=A0A562TLW8_9SPHI|nr:glycoside hydrolase family 3 N-terminal domain-containing protein [Mucilaginibacter frigoritolerans]TWI94569.1 beta-glucosidase [Mucilaginibacter frigoritolerans]